MLTLNIEVFRPTREFVSSHLVANNHISKDELNEQVHKFVVDQLPAIEKQYPEVTEVRWEYQEYGQGHYIIKCNGEWFI